MFSTSLNQLVIFTIIPCIWVHAVFHSCRTFQVLATETVQTEMSRAACSAYTWQMYYGDFPPWHILTAKWTSPQSLKLNWLKPPASSPQVSSSYDQLISESTLFPCSYVDCYSDLCHSPWISMALFPFESSSFLPLLCSSLSFSLSLSVDSDENGTCPYSSAWAEPAPRKVESRGASQRIREEEGKKHEPSACSHCPVWFCLLLCWYLRNSQAAQVKVILQLSLVSKFTSNHTRDIWIIKT